MARWCSHDAGRWRLYAGDCVQIMGGMPPSSVDLVVADPPYFLSHGGTTCHAGERAPVDKGEWDAEADLTAIHRFNLTWVHGAARVLRPDGSIWVFGTYHNLFSVGLALQQWGFRVLNSITWQKPNPPPNLGCRCFTHSTEVLLWAARHGAKHTFHYHAMKEENGGKQMKDVWSFGRPSAAETAHGRHPCQKPEALLERVLRASTEPDDLVLDPFSGSGTTGIAAARLGRRFIGLDREPEWLRLAESRYTRGPGATRIPTAPADLGRIQL